MNVIAIHRATLLYKQGPLSYSSKLVTAGGLRPAARPQALSNKCWCQRVKLMGATLRDVKLVGNLARPNLGSAWVVGEKCYRHYVCARITGDGRSHHLGQIAI